MTHLAETALIHTISKYVRSNVFTKAIELVYAYLKPKLLPPEYIGLWNLLSLIIDLSDSSHLGSRTAIRYIIPGLDREKKFAEIDTIQGSVYNGTLFIILCVAIGLTIYSLLCGKSVEVKIGIAVSAILVILNWYYQYLIEILKAHQNFKIINASNYFTSTLKVVSGCLLVYAFGIYGLFVTVTLTLYLTIVFIKKRYQPPKKNDFELQVFLKLIKDGYPILIIDTVLLILKMTDQLLITNYLGLELLGYYSIATLIADIMLRIPLASREVIEPKMAENIGILPLEKTLSLYYLKPLYSNAYYGGFFFLGVFFFLPVVLPYLLPRYIHGVGAAQILAFGAIFMALSYTPRGIITLNKWQLKTTLLEVIAIVINLIIGGLAIYYHYGINGVAVGATASYFALFCLIYFYVAYQYKDSEIKFARHFLYSLIPLSFLLAVVWFFQKIQYSANIVLNNALNYLVIEQDLYFFKYLNSHFILASSIFFVSSLMLYALIYFISRKNPLLYCYTFNKSTS